MTVTPLADTIAAIATAVVPAQGSVGIVRLSGSLALSIAQQIFKPAGSAPWESHRMIYGWIYDAHGQRIDEALAVWMGSPRSYTREDVVELHCHGGIMVVQATLQHCLQRGARLAEPGEFTLRAFLNGRIDLTQAESIQDLISAYSPQAAAMAVAGLQGQLTQPIQHMRHQAIHLLAEIEARIDFEEDLPPLDLSGWRQDLAQLQQQISDLLATADRGELLRSGVKIAIVGQPNVGKSSLLNAWSGQDRAIVTDLPGTTRDVVESRLVVRGIPVQLLDTAGIRETVDRVERLGVERSYRLAAEADLLILVVDAQQGWTPAETQIYEGIAHKPVIGVINKIDLIDRAERPDLTPPDQDDQNQEHQHQKDQIVPPPVTATLKAVIGTIASQGEGIDALESAVEQIAYQGQIGSPSANIAINQRQQAALVRAQASLQQVTQSVDQDLPLDFWTIDLRAAIQALGEITGEEVTESVLDRIFSQFCIGK